MITKAEAAILRQSYITQMPARIEALIRAAAASGANSVIFNYAPAPDVDAQTFATGTLAAAGWTATVDTVNKILTIS